MAFEPTPLEQKRAELKKSRKLLKDVFQENGSWTILIARAPDWKTDRGIESFVFNSEGEPLSAFNRRYNLELILHWKEKFHGLTYDQLVSRKKEITVAYNTGLH